MAKSVLTDSSFWIALFESRDEHHEAAQELWEEVRRCHILIPWPILYEVLNTRFVKKPIWVRHFNEIINHHDVTKVDDGVYRAEAFQEMMDLVLLKQWKLSLVDVVIRSILLEKKDSFHSLITYNPNDFRDVCIKGKISINFDPSM